MFDFQGTFTSVDSTCTYKTDRDWPNDRHAPQSSVLLVDDDADSLLLLAVIFEQFPCSVVCETAGELALRRLEQRKFDLVMLDIQLPDISGLDVVRQLRQNPLLTTLPVVAVTAMARPQDEQESLLAGCDRYISKPYLIEDIEKVARQFILQP